MKKTFLSFIVLGIISSLFSDEVLAKDKSKDLKITIYNQGLGFVVDKRDFYLPNSDENSLSFVGIPSSIMIDSVVPIFSNPYTTLFSQSFERNIINYQTLLEYYKKNNLDVKFYELQEDLNKRVLSSGRVLSILGDRVSIEKSSGDIVTVLVDNIIFDKGANLLMRSKPSLTWRIKSKKGNQNIILHYLTNNISWMANYTLNLDKKASLRGWINIENNTGISFENANISCIAGEISRISNLEPKLMRSSIRKKSNSIEIKPESFSGYHLYKIPFQETLSQGNKQISFIDKVDLNYDEYAYIDMNIPTYQIYGSEEFYFDHIVEMNNLKKNGLGVELPDGKIRVFSNDGSHELHFIGEDYLKHLSKGERLKIKIGKFFDVKGEMRQIIFKNSSRKSKEHLLTKIRYSFYNGDIKPRTINMMLHYKTGKRHKIKSTCKSPCLKQKIDAGSYLYTINLNAGEKYNYTLEYELNPF